jgi:outer membrane protein assembly factor BamD
MHFSMKNISIHTVLFPIALFLVFLAGCAHEQPGVRTAQEIFQEASELAQKGKVDQASEKFMEVRTYYPGDDLAKKALMATADLYYNSELYESALQSYEEYRLLYPTDPEASYALYRVGLCHFNQMGDPDRDQTQTVKAIRAFENFLSSFPSSQYAQPARDNLAAARKVLASNYVYIGKFYLKKKDYTGACKRFQYVKSQFPGVQLEDDLDALISRACSTGVQPEKKS